MSRPLAIVINGTSSVGKTTVAKMMLEALDIRDLLYVGVDTFVNMLPPCLVGENEEARSGFHFVRNNCGFDVEVGELGEALIGRMHDLARSLLENGTSLIIDHVLLSDVWVRQLERLEQTQAIVLFFLVTCDPDEMSKREQARGDRRIGLGAGLRRVETMIKRYDLVIDTTSSTREETLQLIAKHLSKRGIRVAL